MDERFLFIKSYIFWVIVVLLTLYSVKRTGIIDATSLVAGILGYAVVCSIIVLIYQAFSKPKKKD